MTEAQRRILENLIKGSERMGGMGAFFQWMKEYGRPENCEAIDRMYLETLREVVRGQGPTD